LLSVTSKLLRATLFSNEEVVHRLLLEITWMLINIVADDDPNIVRYILDE
jgi:hypothetical protein